MAIWPGQPTRDALARLALPQVTGISRTAPANLHATLRFIGEPPGPPEAVIAALRTVRVDRSPTVIVGPSTCWIGRYALCLPAGGLDPLAGELDRVLADIGIGPRPERFLGHITIARARRNAPESVLGTLVDLPFDSRFPARTFDLVNSMPSPVGPTYESVATFRI